MPELMANLNRIFDLLPWPSDRPFVRLFAVSSFGWWQWCWRWSRTRLFLKNDRNFGCCDIMTADLKVADQSWYVASVLHDSHQSLSMSAYKYVRSPCKFSELTAPNLQCNNIRGNPR